MQAVNDLKPQQHGERIEAARPKPDWSKTTIALTDSGGSPDTLRMGRTRRFRIVGISPGPTYRPLGPGVCPPVALRLLGTASPLIDAIGVAHEVRYGRRSMSK